MSFLTTSYLGWVPESGRGFRMGSPIRVSLTLLLQQWQTQPFRGLSVLSLHHFYLIHSSQSSLILTIALSQEGTSIFSMLQMKVLEFTEEKWFVEIRASKCQNRNCDFPSNICWDSSCPTWSSFTWQRGFYNNKDIIWKWVIFLLPEPFVSVCKWTCVCK